MPETADRQEQEVPTAKEVAETGRYTPSEIEPRWQARWDADPTIYAADPPSSGKPKYYVLEMLPYPSGQLHIGHVRNYSIGDALARFMWMRGANVLHPMGWDAFGLPAENAALKNHTPPREWTLANIGAMRAQFQRMGFSYDWAGTEVTTCLPDYYRWNQWFFLKMYAAGLAYRKKSKVNWCPDCQTVLANEQVIAGRCWRHEDTPVEQRDLTQWFLRITRYADELLADLQQLDGWPEKVRTMQANWIGRSEGAEVTFPVVGSPGETPQTITVFTTRIDTIFGATSLQLAPEHTVAQSFAAQSPELAAQIEDLLAQQKLARESGDLGAIEKHGVPTGRFATNPFSGEQIPIWIGNYILADYGTGAIMSVPAHDDRDFEFATKYGLEIRRVLAPNLDTDDLALPYTAEAEAVLVDSGVWTGEAALEAQSKMAAHARENGFGRPTVTYRLKDWGVSRQRYWGTPIPMVYCEDPTCGDNGLVPLPESALPVLLPEQVEITQQGGSPLGRDEAFVNTTCPQCGGPARRETDTMDTFVDSSWYFYRYTDAHNSTAPFSPEKVSYWFPIDQYVGGVEHAILHLIYSRFWTRMMRDLGLVKNSEPAARQFSQGMVIKDGAKMSKSRGNVVSPDEMIARYGADATRTYALFAAPPDRDLDWQEDGVAGVSRFLAKVYRLTIKYAPVGKSIGSYMIFADKEAFQPEERKLLRLLYQTIGKVTQDFSGRWHFNTSIAAIMILVNEIAALEPAMDDGRISKPVIVHTFTSVIQILAPFAPFIAAELWDQMNGEGSVLRTPWPEANAYWAKEDEIEIPVQVNGKLVNVVTLPADATEDAIKAAALADEKVARRIEGKAVVKVIVVPGKLINIVVR